MSCCSFSSDLDWLRKPVGSLVVGPLTLLLCAILRIVPNADSMLSIVLPLSDIFVTVREDHGPLAIFLARLKVSLILTSILVGQLTLALE